MGKRAVQCGLSELSCCWCFCRFQARLQLSVRLWEYRHGQNGCPEGKVMQCVAVGYSARDWVSTAEEDCAETENYLYHWRDLHGVVDCVGGTDGLEVVRRQDLEQAALVRTSCVGARG